MGEISNSCVMASRASLKDKPFSIFQQPRLGRMPVSEPGGLLPVIA